MKHIYSLLSVLIIFTIVFFASIARADNDGMQSVGLINTESVGQIGDDSSNKRIGAGSIICGYTPNGQANMCDTSINKCLKCKSPARPWFPILGSAMSLSVQKIEYQYVCVPRNIKNASGCSNAPQGGGKGESFDRAIGFIKFNEEVGEPCIVQNFISQYGPCYACKVIETLVSAFIKAAGQGYEVSRKLGNAIVYVGILLWLAVFVLQKVSSFAAVEPMQMLQELFVQLFKVIVALVILNSGIRAILDYTLVPFMNTGTAFAREIINSTANLNISASYNDLIGVERDGSDGGGGRGSVGGGEGFAGGAHGGGTR